MIWELQRVVDHLITKYFGNFSWKMAENALDFLLFSVLYHNTLNIFDKTRYLKTYLRLWGAWMDIFSLFSYILKTKVFQAVLPCVNSKETRSAKQQSPHECTQVAMLSHVSNKHNKNLSLLNLTSWSNLKKSLWNRLPWKSKVNITVSLKLC